MIAIADGLGSCALSQVGATLFCDGVMSIATVCLALEHNAQPRACSLREPTMLLPRPPGFTN